MHVDIGTHRNARRQNDPAFYSQTLDFDVLIPHFVYCSVSLPHPQTNELGGQVKQGIEHGFAIKAVAIGNVSVSGGIDDTKQKIADFAFGHQHHAHHARHGTD